jgi:flagellar protein FliJ
MKKPASLDTVLDVSRRKRDEALQTLGAAQREWQQAQAQMAQLQGYSQESLQRWSQRAAEGVTPMLLRAHQQFMARLDNAVLFQNGVLQRLQLNMEHCQQQVMQAERDLASLNKYAERREQVWQCQLLRQEQKSNDEMAANLHRQHASATSWRHST